jgi:hypothetical protein
LLLLSRGLPLAQALLECLLCRRLSFSPFPAEESPCARVPLRVADDLGAEILECRRQLLVECALTLGNEVFGLGFCAEEQYGV